MDGQNRRPCKFGNNCNKYQQGTCTFSHDYNPNMGGGGGRQRPNNYPTSNYQPSGGRGGYNNTGFSGNNNGPNYPNNVPNTYTGGNLGGRGGRGGGNYPPNQQQNQQNNNDISYQFCRFFQTAQCSKPGCKKAHEFTKGNNLKRIFQTKQVPTAPHAKLGMLEANGTKVFTLKLNNIVTLFQYNPQNQQSPVAQLNQNLTLQYPQIHFYMSKEKYIYFAYENKLTSFTNIGYIDVMTQQRITVDAAHKLPVSGLIHINDINNQPIVLSSSIQGSIKAWKIQGEKLVLNNQISQGFQKCIESDKKFQVLFLKKDFISGNQVIAAGTSDNRLFFWIGKQLTLQKISFPDPYNKVLSIKYIQNDSNWIALLIILNEAMNMSSIMAINLSNMQFQSVIQEKQVPNPKLLFYSVEAVGELLFVSNWQGMVSIYKIPNFNQKIGCIMHNNPIAEMINFSTVTSTGIQMLNLMILEEVGQKHPGSLSIFTLR